MQKKLLAALTLFALALGLVGGPHPCRAQQVEKSPPVSKCHGMGADKNMQAGGHAHSREASDRKSVV